MKILVLNCGSSSIKYQLFDMATKDVLAKGGLEKIGMKDSFLKHVNKEGKKFLYEEVLASHEDGIDFILAKLIESDCGCLKSYDDIQAVGHRVVHGGASFTNSVLINNHVIDEIKKCIPLGPLHNPHNLKGIYAMQAKLPKVPQVAVFDTAFHQTMPDYAYMYALPYTLYEKYGIRRYGFHGTSHRYISERACEMLGLDYTKAKIVTCHLGNGASVAAIKEGKCVDTSMGLTPVEGLIMGTRCGDIDAGALVTIMNKEELHADGLNELINKKSGMIGITGISSDMRDVEDQAWNHNNQRAWLGLHMYHYRVRKYIGSYAAAMGGVDAIVFAGGVGENGPETREEICRDLEFLGCKIDKTKNDGLRGKEMDITTNDSKTKILVVPTNEELVIANDTLEIIQNLK